MFCKRKEQIVPEPQCAGNYREANIKGRGGICRNCNQGIRVFNHLKFTESKRLRRSLNKAHRNLERLRIKMVGIQRAKHNIGRVLREIWESLEILGLDYNGGKYGKHSKETERDAGRLRKAGDKDREADIQ